MKSNSMPMRVDTVVGIVKKVTKWSVIVSAICLAAMLLINVIEVVGAKWFHWSLIGHLELTEQLMVLVSILPIAFIALERGHIRITMVVDRIPSAGRLALEVLGYGLGTLVMAFCTWRAFVQMQYAMDIKLDTNTLLLPIWPTNLVIVVGFGLLALSCLLLLVKTLIVGKTK
jgi:TRAP-type C4-dicarboxylate transport system permease small subunit